MTATEHSCEHHADPRRVELVLEDLGLERGGVLGDEDAIERPVRHADALIDRDDGSDVFRLALEELLVVTLADGRLREQTTPGCAPSTPASQDPFVEETLPSAYSAVSSPKYQTFPNRSWAYQSNVSSARSPFAEKTWSCTTVVVTPRITFVRPVTTT